MRVSWNWLSELIDLSQIEGPHALAHLLTSRGLEVESIDRMDQGFEQVVVAQILEFRPHPQADRLNLCQVSVGKGEPLQIVCGAPNVKAGAKVALAQVGAHLPNGVKIVASRIRGVESNGMLCSEQELKLSEQSEGILILPDSTEVGLPVAQVLGRSDTLFTLKLTANRGDCLSHLGIAREVGSALRISLKSPIPARFELSGGNSPIAVHLDAGEAAPQLIGCLLEEIQVGPSPEWLVRRLESLGCRSVNNVVDVTNWVMFELGYPMHAYDADQILGNQIHVRVAHEGESLSLLDGHTILLQGFELVIADARRALSLAGVMGGSDSEVHSKTRRIFLECAEFDPVLVRRASAFHQKKTEASHRFERGIDPKGLVGALKRLTGRVLELAGGTGVGLSESRLPGGQSQALKNRLPIQFSLYYLNDFLGFPRDQSPLTLDQVEEIFLALNCEVQRGADHWAITPPSYRLDLTIQEDFAEEIARSVGYDQIPATLPALTSSPVFSGSSLPRIQAMDRAKESLVRSGLRETLNFSFSNPAWLARFGGVSSVPIVNPLNQEYSVMVPSLIPGLVQNALDNWSHHFGSESMPIRLFELRPVFSAHAPVQASQLTDTGVTEAWKISFLISGPRYAGGLRSEQGEVDFYDLKSIVERLFSALGTQGIRYLPLSASRTGGNSLYHPGQSVELYLGNSIAGYFGLLHPARAKDLKVRAPLWLAEFDWEIVARLSRKTQAQSVFKAWSAFPPIERDFALVVGEDVTADKLCQVAFKSGKPLVKEVKVFDIYRGIQVAEGMTSVAVRVIFYDEQRSIQESEAETVSVRILECWKKDLGAQLRG